MIALRAALVLAVLVFMPRLVESFEVPKIVLVRALGTGAFVAWLLGSPWRRRLSFFEGALLGWLAAEALTTAMSVSPRVSLFGDALQHEGLLTSFGLAGLALGAREALADPRALGRTTAFAIAAASLACVYALLQVAGFDPLPWSRTATYGAGFVRPFGTLGHPNLLGVIGAAACAWSVAFAIRTPEQRWIWAPAALLTGLATILTFSRAAWLGLATGLAVVALATWFDRAAVRLSWRPVAGAAAVIALVLALFWSGGWSRLFAARTAEFAQAGGDTGSSRVEIWTSAMAAWRDRPLTGQGPDTFELTFPQFQTPAYWRVEWGGVPFHAHSIYLHTLATRGVAGALALLALAIAAAVAARRAWRAGAAARVTPLAGGIAAITVAGLAGAIGINGALWLLLSAAALDAAARAGDSDATPRGPRAARRPLVAALAVTATLAAGWGGYREIGVSRGLAYASQARVADPRGALAAATHAATLAPGDDRVLGALSEARLTLGASRRDPSLIAAAEDAATRATVIEPLRGMHWQRLGSARATRALLGDSAAPAAMVRAYARATALAPFNVLPALEYARWEIVLGRPALAIAPARAATRLYPEETLPRTTFAAALLAAGERDSARVELEIAMKGRWREKGTDQATAADVLSRLMGVTATAR
jgi:O-antigen ligase